jgi:hypothetical protein
MSRGTPPPPPVTKSEYLTGARPVVGTVGACGMMVLACSWFVLGPGDLGRSRDVGTPTPVHIGEVTGERDAAGVPTRRGVPARSKARDVSAKGAALHTSVAPRPGRNPGPVVAAAQFPSARPAAPAPAAAPAAPGVPAAQPAPEPPAVTPALPAPLDGLPEVTQPPAPLPPVSVPQVPSVPLPEVPAVTTITTQLGLP